MHATVDWRELAWFVQWCERHRVVANGDLLAFLNHRSVHVVQVSTAYRAEYQQRIRIEALGQRLLRKLPELDTRLQHDLDDGSEHRLRSIDNISRSKEPHSVDKPDHALLIAAQCDVVVGVSVREKIRRAHQKIDIK